MLDDIRKSPYAEWLEDLVEDVVTHEPGSIAVVMLTSDSTTLTAYYQSNCQDKAVMAHNIYMDAIWDMIKANAKEILRIAEDDEDEPDEEETGG